ncbi:MAG TPA: ComF family protein [Alphaproteobacteria bacterium]|nr:ComF family protein [Alphaproteobacteria bacterium]
MAAREKGPWDVGGSPIDRAGALGSDDSMTAGDGIGGRLSSPIGAAVSGILDLLLPHQCLKCGEVVGKDGALCASCWSAIAFMAPPMCARCGYPFELDSGFGEEAGLCGACLRNPPPYDRARAVFRYDEQSRSLVLGLKHGDKTHGVPAFGAWLARAAGPLAAEADLVAPVPLHRWRLFRRRYNQAALLATAVSRAAGIACMPGLLTRVRATPSQGRLSRSRRRLNVRGAFAVAPGHRPAVEGRRVLLIDDVLTTGATVEAAARCLTKAGAGAVDVLTLARVVRPVS